MCREGVLCVGLCCLDIVSQVMHYPEEDTDQRCLDQRWQRGGNAANNSTVLGLLRAKSAFCGTVADSYEKRFLLDDFAKYGVNTDNVVVHKKCEMPVSCVTLSQTTGSRTIIHSNKNLPEITVDDFKNVDLTPIKWVNFEGRNVANVIKMIEHVRDYNKTLPPGDVVTISVEVEKATSSLDPLIALPDVVFVSKDYAIFKGYSNMVDAVEKVSAQTRPGCIVICPWGEAGACGVDGKSGEVVKSAAFPPPEVMDTLGAGDTFNAATIYGLTAGYSLKDSITLGCRVAGAKVGVRGWEPLRDIIAEVVSLLPDTSLGSKD